MPKNILVSVAWPYASADIHVGNVTGSYLPADIFARFQRLRGNNVLMVSGSDAHGTPITVKADAEGLAPEEVYQQYHVSFIELFQKLGLNYDLFTSTHTENHEKVSQAIFLALEENGYLYPEEQEQWYSASLKRFLPDRYVEGTCYICGYDHARGDQCDNCGNILDATQLINPRAKTDGSTPELRKTSHYFIALDKLQEQVVNFLESRESYWRPNVVRRSLGWIKKTGLRGRPITRDLDWGIPVPVEGWEEKRLYVWFEAVIGYLSAAIEWAQLTDEKDAWQNWWTDAEARSYYFIGKDNIDFHAIMWPAQLAGAKEAFAQIFAGQTGKALNLPYDVPANEFLNMEDRKISGSQNWGVWVLDFLSRFDPDPLRYYLSVNMPETRDSNWDWDDFVRRNNDELVATWGNLVNRTLTFAHKNWEGQIPEPGDLRKEDKDLLANIENGFETVGAALESVSFRAALEHAFRLAREVNVYLDTQAPWTEIKEDKDSAAKTIFTAIKAIDNLKLLLSPFLPHSCEQLHTILGYEEPIFGRQYTEDVSDSLGTHTALRYSHEDATGDWAPSQLEGGRAFNEPQPLFKKLDPDVADEERARLS
jgi:methionyl-tRNA synthetase